MSRVSSGFYMKFVNPIFSFACVIGLHAICSLLIAFAPNYSALLFVMLITGLGQGLELLLNYTFDNMNAIFLLHFRPCCPFHCPFAGQTHQHRPVRKVVCYLQPVRWNQCSAGHASVRCEQRTPIHVHACFFSIKNRSSRSFFSLKINN